MSPAEGLEVLLPADGEEDLGGAGVLAPLGEAAEVALGLVPRAAFHEVAEVLGVEEEPRLLL